MCQIPSLFFHNHMIYLQFPFLSFPIRESVKFRALKQRQVSTRRSHVMRSPPFAEAIGKSSAETQGP